MRTLSALNAFTGRSHEHGDGPLSNVARELLQNFRAKEAHRLAEADERAAMAGKGPVLDVLRRKLADAHAADLFQDNTPIVTRFEAYQALRRVRSRHPDDHGLRMASVHLEHLWHKDALGTLTLGEVAKLREHYKRQFPRSVVAEAIDAEIPKVGFNTLPVSKLAPLAAQIQGRTEEERQFAYEQVIRAHGLQTNRPEHRRARDFIRALADMNSEHARPSDVLERTIERLGQMSPMPQAEPMPAGPEMAGMPEGMMGQETAIQVESPLTGQPLQLELTTSPEGEVPADEVGQPEVQPGVVASLSYFGQLEQFNAQPPEAGVNALEPEPMAETEIEDPSAPGEMLKVEISPAESASLETGMSGAPAAPPGMDNQASQRRVFAVFSMRGGVQQDRPIERVAAQGMAEVLSHVAARLEGSFEVRADQNAFVNEAFIVLDDSCGNYLRVVAESEFEPEVVNGQPVVRHNLQLSQGQGLQVLTTKETIKQNVPKAKGDEPEEREARLTPQRVQALCKQAGLTAKTVEAKVLDGEVVTAGAVTLRLNDEGELELMRGDRGRAASLVHLDKVISDFQVLAARELHKKSGRFRVRALFTVGCPRCQTVGEYLMPDSPQNIRCATCNWITPPEAVALQLETRQASAFPGYVITADVPGAKNDLRLNARRMLAEIKKIAQTDGARVRSGQLEVAVRGAGEAELNRIRRVLADVFGAREIVAQAVPDMTPPSGNGPQLAPANHPNIELQPAPQPMPPQALPQAPQPAPGLIGGGGAQQYNVQTPADQPAGAPLAGNGVQREQVASRLPCGPHLKHAHVQYADGRTLWIPVEASNERAVRDMIASSFDGTKVLAVRDSIAQLTAPPETPSPMEAPMPMTGAPGMAGTPGVGPGMGTGGHPENIETAAVDPKLEETIRAALLTSRSTGVPIDDAIKTTTTKFSSLLEQYGDAKSPTRHMLGGVIVRIAKEIYEQPALVAQRRVPRRAADPKGPQPKKINEQQDDWVNLPGAGELLGSDSETEEGFKNPKVNEEVDTIATQPGASGASTKQQPDTASNDPKRFKAPKPPSDGQVKFDGPGWGQSYADTNLGESTENKDNPETKSWDALSSGAYGKVRSK